MNTEPRRLGVATHRFKAMGSEEFTLLDSDLEVLCFASATRSLPLSVLYSSTHNAGVTTFCAKSVPHRINCLTLLPAPN
jgi:hypothetical protein